jgi:transcriptional regulator with XRE-family HTH domain
MVALPSILIIECRTALRLTQERFGDLLGQTKRTVQRWEARGGVLLPSQVETLIHALRGVRPDLAERVASTGGAASVAARAAALESVVRAAADAIGVAPDAVRPAVAAAFARALEASLDLETVAEALKG